MVSPAAFRGDIQVLRGYAVLLVVLYHAKVGLFPHGYLGVDVFFVISGFLITKMLKEQIEAGNFSFVDFYSRRARRLLPSAYVVFFVVTVCAPFFLAWGDLKDFFGQLLGALSFSGNFVLWRQGGYFGGDSAVKPLLHVWSLAIEEQYYFILPLALVWIPSRFWLKTIVVLVFGSAVLCFLTADKYAAAFYLLPTRAWELLIGSVGAFVYSRPAVGRLASIAFYPSCALLLFVPVSPFFDVHPGYDALIVCVSTLVVILRGHPGFDRELVFGWIHRLGDVSYSLYLVHWPIFAFLNNLWVGDGVVASVPLPIKVTLVVMSLVLAFLLNRFVEEPLRHRDFLKGRRAFGVFLAGAVVLVLVNQALTWTAVPHTGGDARRPNYGLDRVCAPSNGVFSSSPLCRTSDSPKIFVWGDSYAMHLIPGLVSSSNAPALEQGTMSKCSPIVGSAVVEKEFIDGSNKTWARGCIAFNDSILSYLKVTESIKVVVMSSPFDAITNESKYRVLSRVNTDASSYELKDGGVSTAALALSETVEELRRIGKKVVLVEPPPKGGFDSRKCHERADAGLVSLSAASGCEIKVKVNDSLNGPIYRMLSAVEEKTGVGVISLKSQLCDEDKCKTTIGDTYLYRDRGHLSVDGSALLGRELGLYEMAFKAAR